MEVGAEGQILVAESRGEKEDKHTYITFQLDKHQQQQQQQQKKVD